MNRSSECAGQSNSPPSLARAASKPIANAEDVAAMGVVLMSERYAGYVTGADIVVDRGLSLHNWFAPAVP